MGRILRTEQFCKWVTEPSLERASRSISYQSYGLKENIQLGLDGMRNLELYGVEKVAQELRNRELHILSIASNGEKAARTMAWKMFCEDELKIDDSNSNLSRLAQIQYFHAVDLLPQYGLSMDVDERKFRDFFLDELWVINKSVTKKGVQLVFYVFVALGLFGLYKIFF